jgi:carbamoyl-phosphate synthase large subunit
MSITIAVTGLHRGENPQPGYGVIRSLRRHSRDLNIIGLVYDVLESGIYADQGADQIYQFPYPSAGAATVLGRLDYIHHCSPIDIFLPTLDSEIHLFVGITEEIQKRGIRCMLPSEESYQARSKSNLGQLADSCRMQTPLSETVGDVDRLVQAAARIGYPLMLKGQYYEAYKVYSQPQLIDRFHDIVFRWGAPVVVQRYVEGPEFDVVAVGDGTGGVAASCSIRKTILSEKGKGFGGITISDERLDELAFTVVRELKWQGPIELEFIQDEITGEYYLLEVNPRFPAWIDFPAACGVNLAALVVEALWEGQMSEIPACVPGKFFLRHSIDLLCDIEDMGTLASVGEWTPLSRANV